MLGMHSIAAAAKPKHTRVVVQNIQGHQVNCAKIAENTHPITHPNGEPKAYSEKTSVFLGPSR